MSFQDFGKGGGRPKTNRAGTTTVTPAFGGGSSKASGGGLSQISESLLQYQRNVGILDKIVQQLLGVMKRQAAGNLKELQMQYQVQIDVVMQLEEKAQAQLTDSSSTPAMVKLSRDFDRVKGRVKTLKAEVERVDKQLKSSDPGDANKRYSPAASSTSNNQPFHQVDTQQLMQAQLEEDQLHQDIMREREEEIRNINRGMHQVNEIYKDLAHIVGSQQEQIDTIETQMEESKANAESGLKEVEKANVNFGKGECVIS